MNKMPNYKQAGGSKLFSKTEAQGSAPNWEGKKEKGLHWETLALSHLFLSFYVPKRCWYQIKYLVRLVLALIINY